MSFNIPVTLQPFSGVNQEYVDRLNQYAQQVMPSIHYRCPKNYTHHVKQSNLPADPSALGLKWHVDHDGHLCFPRSGRLPGTISPSIKNVLKTAKLAQAVSAITGKQLSANELQAVMALYKGGKLGRSSSSSYSLSMPGVNTDDVRSELSSLISAQQTTLQGLNGGASVNIGQVSQEAMDLSSKIVQASEQKEVEKEVEKQAADIIRLSKIVKKHNPLLSDGDAAVQAMNLYKESVDCTQFIGKTGECEASGKCHVSSTPNSTMCMPNSLHERQEFVKLQRDAKKEAAELNKWYRSYNSKMKRIGYGTMEPLMQTAEIEKVATILRKYRDATVDVSDDAQSIFDNASVCSGPDGSMSGNCGKLSPTSSVGYPEDLLQRRIAVDAASDIASQTNDLNAWYRAFYAKQKAQKKSK